MSSLNELNHIKFGFSNTIYICWFIVFVDLHIPMKTTISGFKKTNFI